MHIFYILAFFQIPGNSRNLSRTKVKPMSHVRGCQTTMREQRGENNSYMKHATPVDNENRVKRGDRILLTVSRATLLSSVETQWNLVVAFVSRRAKRREKALGGRLGLAAVNLSGRSAR